jgi:hypothetical protein
MDNSKFVYTLMWYKSKGGSVTNSADVGSLKSICLIESSRPLSYNRTKTQLMLSSEVQPGEESNPVERNNKESQGQHHVDVITHFTFAIVLSDGKEHILRGSKVDKLIKWMNGLAQASNLAYDPINKEWNRVAMQTLIQTRELKKAKEAAELRAKLESAIVNQTIENPLLKRASARPVEPQAAAASGSSGGVKFAAEEDEKEQEQERSSGIKQMLKLKRALSLNPAAALALRTALDDEDEEQDDSKIASTPSSSHDNDDEAEGDADVADDSSGGAGSDNDEDEDADADAAGSEEEDDTKKPSLLSSMTSLLRNRSNSSGSNHGGKSGSARESPRESPRESSRESPRETPRDMHSDSPKHSTSSQSPKQSVSDDQNDATVVMTNPIKRLSKYEAEPTSTSNHSQHAILEAVSAVSISEPVEETSTPTAVAVTSEEVSSGRKPPPKRSQIRRSVLLSQADNINKDEGTADDASSGVPETVEKAPVPVINTNVDDEAEASAMPSPLKTPSRRKVAPPPKPA